MNKNQFSEGRRRPAFRQKYLKKPGKDGESCLKSARMKVDHTLTKELFVSSLSSYVLSSLAYAIGPLVDGAVIGNYLGEDAVSAYGMVWPAILILALTGGVVAGGARNMYTKLIGQGQTDEANRVYTIAQLFSFLLSVLYTAIVWIYPEEIAGLLGAQGNAARLQPVIADYLKGFSLGVPFMNAAKILSSFMTIDSDAGRNVSSVIYMTIADVIGDLVIVLAIRGSMLEIGIATSVGYLIQFIALSMHFRRKKRILRYSFRNLSHIPGIIKDIIFNGAPSGTSRIAAAVGGVIINYVLASYASGDYIAAYSVQKSIASLFSCIYLGAADTIWTMSSIYFGEEDRKALNSLQLTALKISENLSVIIAAILFLFAGGFARIYLSPENPEAFGLAIEAIRIYALAMPLYTLVYGFMDYLIGTKHLIAANIYAILQECGCIAPVVFLLVLLMGGRGVWFASLISLGLMLITALLLILFHPNGKGFNDKRLLLYKGFGIEAGQELSISATTKEEVVGMSRLSGLFCQENGISKSRAFILSLCVEEMAMNILNHGFTGKKPVYILPQIDIRFLIKNDEIILRIRDNGIPFNPVEQYEMSHEDKEDPAKNLGIRLTMKMSTDVSYFNMNKTNNLIIRI